MKLIALIAALLAVEPANAASFAFSIDTGFGVGTGTLSTSGDADTLTLVTSLTGIFGGAAITLLAPNQYPTSYPNDNLFTFAAPYFDNAGMSFSAGGSSYNIYYEGRGEMPSLRFCGHSTGCEVTTLNYFSVNAIAVPEPASWALTFIGLALLGAAVRYGNRSTSIVYAQG